MSDIETGLYAGEPRNRTPATEATLRKIADPQLEIDGQSVTYAGGQVVIAMPHAMRNVSLFLHPSASSIGVDYTGASDPETTTEWIEVDVGAVAVAWNFVFRGPITGLRLRPIASGAAATYTVRA